MPLKIAIATQSAYTSPHTPWEDDGWLKDELARRGHIVEMLDWQNPATALEQFDAIYVSTTWNIPEDPDAFLQFLVRCEQDGKTRLINAARILSDNIVKSRYMESLRRQMSGQSGPRGSITPSRFYAHHPAPADEIESLDGRSFGDILRTLDTHPDFAGQDIVLKPIISGDGFETYIYHRSSRPLQAKPDHLLDHASAEALFNRLTHATKNRGIILQPYLPAIERGEYSLIFFGEQLSHAIHKPTGFRADNVRARQYVPPSALPTGMKPFAAHILELCRHTYGADAITRARLDLLDGENGPILCELECTEPNTNLGCINENDRPAFIALYADAIEQRAQSLAAQAKK